MSLCALASLGEASTANSSFCCWKGVRFSGFLPRAYLVFFSLDASSLALPMES